MTVNLYVSSVLVSRTMNTPPLMTSWVCEHYLLSSPAHCKCNHQYFSHSAALCFICHSQSCFCHPSDPWQSVSCSWMCCCNKHSLLWLFSVLNSWFVAGKLRHRAAGACSFYLWWGGGAVTEGQEGWVCSGAVVTTEQCLVLFHPFSALSPADISCSPQHLWHVLSTPASCTSSCPQD